MNNIDKNIFNSYEMVEAAFNNDLRAFCADGRTMKTRALKGTSYYFKSGKTGKKYDISPEECRILNLFYNTLNDLNKAQQLDNMMSYYNGNVWWFERAELRRKVIEMVNCYIDAFETWLNEKNVAETETVEKTVEEENEESSGENVADETSSEKTTTTVVEYKLIEGYENYMVSSDGKVWSLNYRHTGKMKELKQRITKDGYLDVWLYTNGLGVRKLVHRLIAQAFLPNPNNHPQVNHIDQDKTNNCVKNLEWCDAKYNNNYGDHNERVAKTLTNREDLSKTVVCLETGEIYPSAMEASRQTGVAQQSISACCNGKLKSAGGCHWSKFVEGDNPIYD